MITCSSCGHRINIHSRDGCQHTYRAGGDIVCTCFQTPEEIAQEAQNDGELYKALYDLFQACSNLCLDDMNKLEKEINAASLAIKNFNARIIESKIKEAQDE